MQPALHGSAGQIGSFAINAEIPGVHENGVLNLFLPKKAATSTKRLAVQ